MCVLYCDITHILLPKVNCTQLYLGGTVNRSEKWVLTGILLTIQVFCDVEPCRLVCSYRHFEGS